MTDPTFGDFDPDDAGDDPSPHDRLAALESATPVELQNLEMLDAQIRSINQVEDPVRRKALAKQWAAQLEGGR